MKIKFIRKMLEVVAEAGINGEGSTGNTGTITTNYSNNQKETPKKKILLLGS